MNTLDTFDILRRASGEISAIAEQCDIDWQELLPQIDRNQTVYKKGIALDNKSRGKVCAYVTFKTTHKGYEYITITFNTFKHGGVSETFNSYQWLKDNGCLDNTNHTTPTATKKAPPTKPKDRTKEFERKKQRFNAFKKLFDSLPPLTDIAGTYLERKGFSSEDLANTGIVFKRGQDNRGKFIVFALGNSEQSVTGFQSIYDVPFIGYNGESRDKDFIFYPFLTEDNEIRTLKTGSYVFLGKPQSKADLIYPCEGLATGLSEFIASGKPCVICLDSGNLAPVIKSLSKQGYSNLTIAADNDINEKDGGNVGIFSALKAVRYTTIKIVAPIMDGKKCDFDDLRQAKGIEEVRQQLENNTIATYSENSLEYHCGLIKYAPFKQLAGGISRACSYAAYYQIATVADYKRVYKRIRAATKARNFDNGFTVRYWLKKYFNRKLDGIKSENTITSFTGVTCHDMTGKDNTAIAKTILSLDKAIIVDNRPMATGKTELMRLIADYHLNRSSNKASYKDIKQFHFDNGGTAKQWNKISNNPKLFKALQDQVNQQYTTTNHESQKTVYVCHRVSLTSSASERLQLEYYDDVLPSQDTPSLAVCVNSMPKHEVSKTVKVLFIDEMRQTLEHIHNGTVKNRLEVYNELIAAIQAADLVICADADFNDSTLDWLKGIANKPLHAITQQATKTGKKLLELGNSNAVLLHAQESLKKGLNVWIATDSMQQARKADILLNSPDLMDKDTAEELMAELLNGSGISEDKVLLVHSENKGDPKQAAFLANPNQESKKYRLVIHTPVISSGISVTNTHFDRVYAIFCNVLAPNEMLQTIARVRTAKEIFVSFKSNHPKDRSINLQDLIDGEMIKRGRFNADTATLKLDNFDQQRLQYIATRNAALNDYKRYFIILAQLKGYDFEQHDLTPWTIKGLGKAAKEQKITQISTASDIDATEAAAIDSKSSPTQTETDSLHRYKVTQLTGKSANTVDELDIAFYMDNGLAKLSNFELIHADVMALKDSDQANHKTRDKLSSKASKHYLFETVINGLEGKRINASGARGVCEFLQDHHKELTSNNMGNYARVSKIPTKQLNGFLNKIGYGLVIDTNSHNVEQWYRVQVNPLVQIYVENRAAIKRQKDELGKLAETQ